MEVLPAQDITGSNRDHAEFPPDGPDNRRARFSTHSERNVSRGTDSGTDSAAHDGGTSRAFAVRISPWTDRTCLAADVDPSGRRFRRVADALAIAHA